MSQENPSKLDRGIDISSVFLSAIMIGIQIIGLFRSGRAPKVPV